MSGAGNSDIQADDAYGHCLYSLFSAMVSLVISTPTHLFGTAARETIIPYRRVDNNGIAPLD